MPRPQKTRRICRMPTIRKFSPGRKKTETVTLTVDEYEALRLLDYEGLTQEQCAIQMGVARATITNIYESARFKVAKTLVTPCRLEVTGGTIPSMSMQGIAAANVAATPVGRAAKPPVAAMLPRSRRATLHSISTLNRNFLDSSLIGNTSFPILQITSPKGANYPMKLAVTYENGQVFQHFGHTQHFKIYDTTDTEILGSMVVDTQGNGHGALAGFLRALGIRALVCGGIGGGALNALAQAEIQVFPGVNGDTDEAVRQLLAGTLVYDPNTVCAHHPAHEEDAQHTCGEHTCSHSGSCHS